MVFLEEAGGIITDVNGRELYFTLGTKLVNNNGVVASNGVCHYALISAIRTIAT